MERCASCAASVSHGIEESAHHAHLAMPRVGGDRDRGLGLPLVVLVYGGRSWKCRCPTDVADTDERDTDVLEDTGDTDRPTSDTDGIRETGDTDRVPADTDVAAGTDVVADRDVAADTDTAPDTDAAPDTDIVPGETGATPANASDATILAQCATPASWTEPERRHLAVLTSCLNIPDGHACPSIEDGVDAPAFGRNCSDEVLVCGIAFSFRVNNMNPADTDDTGTSPLDTGWTGHSGGSWPHLNGCCYSYAAEPARNICY